MNHLVYKAIKNVHFPRAQSDFFLLVLSIQQPKTKIYLINYHTWQILTFEKLEPENILNFFLKYDWNVELIVKIVAK